MSSSLASTSRTAILTAASLAALLALPAPASAQQDDQTADAEKYYKQGMQAFYEDDYGMAITNFKRAHSISPSATLLFNISLGYSKMAKPEEALENAEKATEFDDMPDDTRVKNQARMTGYRVAIRGREVGGGQASAGGGTSTGGGPPTDTGTHALRWIGVSVGVIGAGLMGGALAVGGDVSSKIDEKSRAEDNGNLVRAENLYRSIESQQTLGQVLLYSGIAAFAGGTTLFVVDAASSSTSSRALDVTGGPTRDGFRVGVDLDF